MPDFLSFIGSWSGLVSDVFGSYPLEAAIFTILSYPAFRHLEKRPILEAPSPYQRPTNIFLIFLVWLVSVPILGAVLGVAYWALGGLGNLADLLVAFYMRFEEQPIFVLALALVAGAAYIALRRFRPSSPKAPMRLVVVVAAFLLSTFLLVPILNALLPGTTSVPPVAAPPNQTDGASTPP